MMILEMTGEDFTSLLLGRAPRELTLTATTIAPPEVLAMLADLAARVSEQFSPAAWLIVEDHMLVGLCSVTRPPQDGVIDIGYGIAPSHRGRGIASRAVGAIAAWATDDRRVAAITAETSTANFASQAVLTRNGFVAVGNRLDEEDGPLICWRRPTG
ncbi:GNAT family N-acetyltransferase [Sphingomonas quercus]|uniref:GNAT family N-acetyltransferase n=1 Tax=Sphingomonas quercus TaxID=2842451 RepID=A0ABS6BKY8_9SPHN|nr:GNAT family N-acetyltransferase [Sphingomonas quercus]MBU3078507.1 GNAT family N-acetyltransferase [Sphingomonas quercus]